MRPLRPPTRYDAVAMTLHWVIAALLLLDFALAISFSQFNPGDALYLRSAYDLHMAFGLCVLLLSLLRVAWRLTHHHPPLPDMALALRVLARVSHVLLYVFIVAAPLTGWLVLSLRHQATTVFGLFSWKWPTLPAVTTMARPERQFWHDLLLPLHTRLSYVGMCLVAVHVAAALYHYFGRRDDVLLRMLPRAFVGARRAPDMPSQRHA
jgi:cytochrome b561